MAEGEDEELRFALGPIELELSVSVERDAAVNGKVKFWVAELGADARTGNANTQTVRLALEPRLAGSGTPHSPVLISGAGEARER